MTNEHIIDHFVKKYGESDRPLILHALNFVDDNWQKWNLKNPFTYKEKIKYLHGLLKKRYYGNSEYGRY